MIGLAFGLIVTCLIMAPSSGKECPAKKLLTFNLALLPRVAKYDSRRLLVLEALHDRKDIDVMCLQEVWYEKDMKNILDAMGSDYPYHYSFIHHDVDELTPKEGYIDVSTPPCSKDTVIALAKCALTKCLGLIGNAMFVCLAQNCIEQTASLSQECITCAVVSSSNPLASIQTCTNMAGPYNRLNPQGLFLLSKQPIHDAEKTIYFPGVLRIIARGFLRADIEGLGTVVCNHLTTNVTVPYTELNQDQLGAKGWEQLQLFEIQRLLGHMGDEDHIMLGDLNTGPEVNKSGRDYIHGEFPKNFDSLLSSGYDDIYEEDDGQCTWCSSNPLQTPPLQNQILDHILLKGFTGRNASRTLESFKDSLISDHFAVTVDVCVK